MKEYRLAIEDSSWSDKFIVSYSLDALLAHATKTDKRWFIVDTETDEIVAQSSGELK
jgi:hypothetical protein